MTDETRSHSLVRALVVSLLVVVALGALLVWPRARGTLRSERGAVVFDAPVAASSSPP